MNELDKLFNDKLHDREFEFKDSYWEAAEQMIEQEEGRRRRGGLWWKLGILLLLIVGLCYFNMDTKTSTKISNTSPDSLEKTTQNISQASTSPSSLEEQDLNIIDIEQGTENQPALYQNAEALSAAQAEGTPTIDQDKMDFQAVATDAIPVKANTTRKGTAGSETINAAIDFPSKASEHIDPQQLDVDVLNKKSNPSLISPQIEQENTAKKKEIAAILDGQSTPLTEEKTIDAITELAVLETTPSLEMPDADCEGCFDLKNIKKKRFSFGVNAEGIVYPFDKDQNWWVGGSAGLIARYKIKSQWYLRSGVNYSLTRGTNQDFVNDLDAIENFEQNNGYRFQSEVQYGFGSRTVETFFTPETFHAIEIPLFLQFRSKKHFFEVGTQLNFLAGVRGRSVSRVSLFPWEQSLFEDNLKVNQNNEKRWMPKENYKKISYNVSLGYKYMVNTKLSIGFNAYYRLGNINKSQNDVAPLFQSNQVESLLTPERLHFRLGANWYFK